MEMSLKQYIPFISKCRKSISKLKPLNMPKLGKRDAHGSTGAGNDQIRFDLIFQTIAPEIEIITYP
jgi:argininosuccinate synthase